MVNGNDLNVDVYTVYRGVLINSLYIVKLFELSRISGKCHDKIKYMKIANKNYTCEERTIRINNKISKCYTCIHSFICLSPSLKK